MQQPWSLSPNIDFPELLEIFGESIPLMVGYFISFLITKILAGLPTIILRVGALSRMLFLRTFFSESKLTQRELDEVYRKENIQYGWEVCCTCLIISLLNLSVPDLFLFRICSTKYNTTLHSLFNIFEKAWKIQHLTQRSAAKIQYVYTDEVWTYP